MDSKSLTDFIGVLLISRITNPSRIPADLKEYGTVQRAVLGIGYREIDSELAKEENLEVQEGIYVGEVYNRSAAMEAGIKEGDVITSINGVTSCFGINGRVDTH